MWILTRAWVRISRIAAYMQTSNNQINMCMYIYIHTYMCVYIQIHTYTHTYAANAHTKIYAYIEHARVNCQCVGGCQRSRVRLIAASYEHESDKGFLHRFHDILKLLCRMELVACELVSTAAATTCRYDRHAYARVPCAPNETSHSGQVMRRRPGRAPPKKPGVCVLS